MVGYKQNDSSDLKLNELLEDTNITFVSSDKTPTYSSSEANDYEEIVDLCLGSNSLVNKISNFSDLLHHSMSSDHFPFSVILQLDGKTLKQTSRAVPNLILKMQIRNF